MKRENGGGKERLEEYRLNLPEGTLPVQKLVKIGSKFESHDSGYPKLYMVPVERASAGLQERMIIQYQRTLRVTLAPRLFTGDEVNRIGALIRELTVALALRIRHLQNDFDSVTRGLSELGALEVRSGKDVIAIPLAPRPFDVRGDDSNAIFLD